MTKPCYYDYDYVLKLETIIDESRNLFRRYNSIFQYPEGKSHNDTMSERVAKKLLDVDEDLLYKVYLKLRRDYEIFDYKLPEFFIFNKSLAVL